MTQINYRLLKQASIDILKWTAVVIAAVAFVVGVVLAIAKWPLLALLAVALGFIVALIVARYVELYGQDKKEKEKMLKVLMR